MSQKTNDQCGCSTSTSFTFVQPEPDDIKVKCSKKTLTSTSFKVGQKTPNSQVDSEALVLLGDSSGSISTFPSSAQGYIFIEGGVARVVRDFPLSITLLLHDDPSDVETLPNNADREVVADLLGNLHTIAGIHNTDSLRYWDGATNSYRTVPLWDVPKTVQGCLDKSECVELVGFDGTSTPDDTTVRRQVGLKGTGIVVVEDQENTSNPSKPLSKARTVPLPNDNSSQIYILHYSHTAGFSMQKLSTLTGNDGATPIINNNGNWEVGGVDTGVAAQGPAGPSGSVLSVNGLGNFSIDGVDTGVAARGEKGDKGDKGDTGTSGTIVTIGDNGNWFLDDVDTGIAANVADASVTESSQSVTTVIAGVASLTPSQVIDPLDEIPLNFNSSGLDGIIGHSSGSPIFTVGETVSSVEIDLQVFIDSVGTNDETAIFKLFRQAGSSNTLLAQTGSSNANTGVSLKYIDTGVPEGTNYYISSVSGTPDNIGGVTYSTNQLSIKVTDSVDVLQSVTLG